MPKSRCYYVFGVSASGYINSSCPQGTREIRQPERRKHPVVDSQLLDVKRALPAFPRTRARLHVHGIKSRNHCRRIY